MHGESASDIPALLEGIYEAHCEEIYSYCLHRLFTVESAQDVTSTVFLRLAENIDSLRFKDDPAVRNWLYGTARNGVRIYLKSEKRRTAILGRVQRERANSSSRIDCNGFDALDWPVLYQALADLSPTHQDIIILRFRQGLRHEEIASTLEMKPVTVRVELMRALNELRNRLKHLFGERSRGE